MFARAVMLAALLAGAGCTGFRNHRIHAAVPAVYRSTWVSFSSFVLPTRLLASGATISTSCSATSSSAGAVTDARNTLVTQGLEPQAVWKYFEALSAIPRASCHEAAVLDWIKRFADDRGLPWREDAAGNMVVERKGMNGGEGAAAVVIQGHVDMVTEKNADSTHDFLSDPIRLLIDGDWLTANGTTLGADNGIGVSAALALLDLPESSGAVLPPLECLFTVEEEIGLKGAFALDGSMVKGRTMLNLDTVEWGSLFVGCAGGGETMIRLRVEEEVVDAGVYEPYRVVVAGLMGGHSGINIHEGRANAIVALVRLLGHLSTDVPSLRLVELKGGDKHNAIPREAFATVLLPKDNPEAIEIAKDTAARVLADLRLEYGTKEVSLSASLKGVGDEETPEDRTYKKIIGHAGVRRLLSLLSLLPHGVVKMSHDLEGLVETSSNLASVAPIKETGGADGLKTFEILCSTRSSLGSSLEEVRRRIKTVAELCGASEVDVRTPYPGWKPDLGSTALQVARDSLRQLLGGREPVIAALHAGLECGVIGDKAPGMDMVSFGPTIDGAHSPDEKVEISSVDKFWRLVLATLEGLAKKSRD